MAAVHGHAQPVGGFLPAHVLDSFRHRPHVVAAAHGSQRAEQQPPGSTPRLPSPRSRTCGRSGRCAASPPACAKRLSTRCSTSSRLRPCSPAMRAEAATRGVALAGSCQISYFPFSGPRPAILTSYRGAESGGLDRRESRQAIHQDCGSATADTYAAALPRRGQPFGELLRLVAPASAGRRRIATGNPSPGCWSWHRATAVQGTPGSAAHRARVRGTPARMPPSALVS